MEVSFSTSCQNWLMTTFDDYGVIRTDTESRGAVLWVLTPDHGEREIDHRLFVTEVLTWRSVETL